MDGANGTNGIDGTNGTDGQSAYELWLAQGNTGTEADFLNSLIGPQGAPGADGTNGTDGINGTNGIDGTNGSDGVDGLLPNGTAVGNTTFWNGTEWVVNNQNLFHDGTNVGISVNTPSNKLDVNGNATIRGGTLQLWPQDAASQEGAQINLSKHGSAANGPTGAWGIDVYQNAVSYTHLTLPTILRV